MTSEEQAVYLFVTFTLTMLAIDAYFSFNTKDKDK